MQPLPAPLVESELSELTAKILVVDDRPANLQALQAIFDGLDVTLVEASSGLEALRRLLNDDFALILMDVQMPGMDGFETAELIRQRPRSEHTPIIFLTGVETAEHQVFRGYALGAVDYLLKPIVPEVLRSKVSVFVDIFRKTEQIRQQADQLRRFELREHQRQLAEAQARWEADRLRAEIRIAAEIQRKLFPVAPLPVSGLDIAGASIPADATGGDYFDYIPMKDNDLAVVIGDVSGHGLGPALLMAELRAYLRALLLTCSDPSEILALVNAALAEDIDGHFATLLLVKLNRQARSLTWASAGHLPGYLLDSNGNLRAELESTGVPLAVLPESSYAREPTYTLDDGETLVLLTDGIVEACGAEQQFFGLRRALEIVRRNRLRPAREILDLLFESVRAFCGETAPLDDLTGIIIKAAADSGGG